jgi:hypothetical protein
LLSQATFGDSLETTHTKKEYATLVEMILTADWTIHAHDPEPSDATKPYADLRRKVLSHHKEMGMEDAFVYAPEDGEYYETAEYEMDSPHMRLIERYDEVLSGRRWRPNWRIAILRPRRP